MFCKDIELKTFEDVAYFNKIIKGYSCEAIIEQGRYIVDAKSILGIFSLDLTKSLRLKLDTFDEALAQEIFKRIER